MSAIGALSRIPLVNPKTGIITPEWFAFLTNLNPTNTPAAGSFLRSNPLSRYPQWGEVDLTKDVIGELPVANGGLGGIVANPGGVLFFQSPTIVASSTVLDQNKLVFGGGAGAGPSTPVGLGFGGTVLHGNAFGLPSWANVDLSFDTVGVLPIAKGGTGTTINTGTGALVLATAPTITNGIIDNPTMSGGSWLNPRIHGQILWNAGLIPAIAQLGLNNSIDVTIVTNGILINEDDAFIWAIYDKTGGGMAFGTQDPVGGNNTIANTITACTFSRTAGSGMNVAIGAAPTTRRFLGFAASLGI